MMTIMLFDYPSPALHRYPRVSPREIAKWCVYALVLLVPGSFVFLPVMWLVRHGVAQGRGIPTQNTR